MNPSQYIKAKYSIPEETKGEIRLPISRWKEWPLLLAELGVKKALELGTYKGQFAEYICKSMPGIDLTVADAWTVYKGYKDFGEHDLESVAEAVTRERAKEYGFKIIKGWSLDIVKEFDDRSLDWCFVDGNHEFRHVIDDVDSWKEKVKIGGIMSSHDFFRNHHKRFGVKEAIPAYLQAYDIDTYFVVANDKCPSVFWVNNL